MAIVSENPNDKYFLHIINGISDAVFISECQPDGIPGKYLAVNKVACELLNFTQDDFLSKSPYDINRVALEEPSIFEAILADIETSGKTLFKTDLLSRDNQWIPVEIGSQLFELDGHKVFFSVARDIAPREQHETSVKTLIHSTVGLTGQKCLEEIVGKLCQWLKMDGACIGVVHGEQLEIRASFFDGQYQEPSRLSVTASPFVELLKGQPCLYPDGANFLTSDRGALPLDEITSFIGSPLFAQDRQIIGFVCAYSRRVMQPVPHVEELLSVIASRAAAECERMHFVRDLFRSEERLRIVFDSTAEAIVGIDLRGEVVFCNPSVVKILGYVDEKEMIGKNFWKMISPQLSSNLNSTDNVCHFNSAITSGEKISSEESFFAHRDGHQIPVEYWSHPMSRDNQLVGAVITFIDITRRKTLEKQLQHSQRMEAIGTLTGGIAHDFNNILTVISGYVGLLQTQISDNPKLLAKIMKIGEAAERGSKLTHGLLAYSRKKSEPSTPVDLNQLILNVQDFFVRVIGERIEKILTLSKQRLVVLADISQLEQVLMNLVTNGRDAMRDGGTLTITTEQTEIDRTFCQQYGYGEPGQYALIKVADTGTGIPREIQQKIFDPFFTTKDTGKGTGLGLAMAWGIVKQHKGYILVDSTSGEGTCFKIYLPLTAQAVVRSAPLVATQLPGGQETILLVEDDPLVRESTHSILTAVGYRVVISDCAEAALKVLDQQDIRLSLILSDVVMPGIKGSEFYQEIRKKSGIPVVFMSGYTFDSLHDQGLVGEDVLLLNKPIKPLEMLTKIREILDTLVISK